MRIEKQYNFLHLLLLGIFLFTATGSHAKDFVVVIDPGHGGHDAGAVGSISKEKNINLNIALKVGRLIKEQYNDVKVIYTRSTDVFIPLTRRAQIANNANADLFISIHTNSVENKARSPQGVETYSLGLARSEENLAVAKRENAVILMEKDYKTRYAGFNPNSSESYIIFEFMQDKYMEQSVHMASLIQNEMSSYCKRNNKGVKQAGFLVLRATSMPSVLVEVGFISHREEERYLNSEAGTQKISQGIFRAFKKYKAEHDQRTRKTTTAATTATATPQAASTQNTPAENAATEKKPAEANTQTANAPASDNGEIRFKIQIMTSGSLLKANDKRFKGLKPVEHYVEQGTYKYTYGNSSDYNEIYRLRKTILNQIPAAFIIAFRGDEKMDVREAIRIFKARKAGK